MAEKEEYIVSARKYRPAEFQEVVGQAHITKTLLNAIANNRLHHAYMFTGPRGVGKTTTARIYAREAIRKGILDSNKNSSVNPDQLNNLDIIEIDGASNNSVDDVRMLRENAKYPPAIGKYKVYIVDEVHMLSNAAFNALLKTLEEPPPHLLFVFATTEPHKVPATIISRCQRFDFRRMSIEDITSQLKMIAETDSIKIDEQSLITIAKKADGSMRDSQSIFDQAVAFCGNDINYKDLASALNLIDEDFYFEISDNIINHDSAAMFDIAFRISQRGYDLRECINGMLEHFRNIMNFQATSSNAGIQVSTENFERLKQTSNVLSMGDVLRIMQILNEAEKEIRFAFQPQIRFEFMLVLLANISKTKDINQLIHLVENGSLPEEKKK
jgi:DNA polymerase-3 subunit gamma/tau